MGFSYKIQYKSGFENKVVDALSRVTNFELLLMAISVLHSDMEQKLIASYDLDVNLTHMISALFKVNLCLTSLCTMDY